MLSSIIENCPNDGIGMQDEMEKLKIILEETEELGTASPRSGLGKILVRKYDMNEKAANYRLLLRQAVEDRKGLQSEISLINCYFFGVNNTQYLHDLNMNAHDVIPISPTPSSTDRKRQTHMSFTAKSPSGGELSKCFGVGKPAHQVASSPDIQAKQKTMSVRNPTRPTDDLVKQTEPHSE